MRVASRVLCFWALLLPAVCLQAQDSPPLQHCAIPPHPKSLSVHPLIATLKLDSHLTQRLQLFRDERLESKAVWHVSDPSTAVIDSDDERRPIIRPLKPGLVQVTAESGGESATACYEVRKDDDDADGLFNWGFYPHGERTFEDYIKVTPLAADLPMLYASETDHKEPSVIRAFGSEGEELWQASLPVTAEQVSLAAENADSGLIALLRRKNGSSIVVRFTSEGAQAWRYDSDDELVGPVTAFNGNVYLVQRKTVGSGRVNSLIALDFREGQVLWSIPFPASLAYEATPCPLGQVTRARTSHAVETLFTRPMFAEDTNVYVEVSSLHDEVSSHCNDSELKIDHRLQLLRVTPEGEPQWKVLDQYQGVLKATSADDRQSPSGCEPGNTCNWTTFIPGEVRQNGKGAFLALWVANMPQQGALPLNVIRGNSGGVAFTVKTDMLTGEKVQWSPTREHSNGKNSHSMGDVIVDDGLVFLTVNSHVIQFDMETGRTFWKWTDAHGWPILEYETGENDVVVQSSGRLFRLGYPRPNGTRLDEHVIAGQPLEAIDLGPFDGKIDTHTSERWLVLKPSGMLGMVWH